MARMKTTKAIELASLSLGMPPAQAVNEGESFIGLVPFPITIPDNVTTETDLTAAAVFTSPALLRNLMSGAAIVDPQIVARLFSVAIELESSEVETEIISGQIKRNLYLRSRVGNHEQVLDLGSRILANRQVVKDPAHAGVATQGNSNVMCPPVIPLWTDFLVDFTAQFVYGTQAAVNTAGAIIGTMWLGGQFVKRSVGGNYISDECSEGTALDVKTALAIAESRAKFFAMVRG